MPLVVVQERHEADELVEPRVDARGEVVVVVVASLGPSMPGTSCRHVVELAELCIAQAVRVGPGSGPPAPMTTLGTEGPFMPATSTMLARVVLTMAIGAVPRRHALLCSLRLPSLSVARLRCNAWAWLDWGVSRPCGNAVYVHMAPATLPALAAALALAVRGCPGPLGLRRRCARPAVRRTSREEAGLGPESLILSRRPEGPPAAATSRHAGTTAEH